MICPNYYWWCGYLILVDHDGDINITSGMEEMSLTIFGQVTSKAVFEMTDWYGESLKKKKKTYEL